ncbi:thioredoxin-disulfide reductase [Clostridium tyrobutyricum]|jgi:thioredoxin reductase (NADPH)|uniref:thioredoxin-disulfide reductase n=1 Tax=Clostridium tyrobutyricum TaxID=1519 RepID=UPI0018AADC5F|nr:thioredoxin-disulfide reductase [Clostridium tyrobutyricum]MBV4421588.1 thioredoxin-disulfide reductase [Clostridium tyrobutyricum]MBV4424734.1 thioredoxin-disulfide reductase [Clostridium tyrobutyricum]MBV4431987.1 thioredoxin-disulfide reductase [Clostridium tyrobutyricum]MBV4440352.1 thioredoxin-disulfide reductase [Clostridium tyrobutyricum]
MDDVYDTIIIGGGPAGLSSGLYSARAKLNTVVIERESYGGQVVTTVDIDNYPGSVENATGDTLSRRMKSQAEMFGTKFISDEIVDVDFSPEIKSIKGKNKTYKTKTVIIATGSNPRPGGFKNEDKLRAKGISYCATCDADFFTDFDVAVVGGGDSAITEAIYLSKFAKHITVIHRRDALRAAKSLQEKAFKNPKISFMWNSQVEEALGEEVLEGLRIKDKNTGETSELKIDGCFVFVGYNPVTELFKGKVDLDQRDYIITDGNMKTNIPGVFAAGDVRQKTLRQIVTAASDGAIAAVEAEAYIENQKL